MAIVAVTDLIRANLSHAPGGRLAGYTTGSQDIRWTSADWNAHPGSVRICQDPAGSDHTADVYDVENYAGTNLSAVAWHHAAAGAFHANTRPGQRHPAIYTSMSNVTPLVNTFIAHGVTSGPKLWIASWMPDTTQALALLAESGGPFPVIGVQWGSRAYYDVNLFSGTWLADVSAKPPPPAPSDYTADGVQTLAGLAAAHHTDVHELIWLMARHRPNGFGPQQAAYLDAGDWHTAMPAGMRAWFA